MTARPLRPVSVVLASASPRRRELLGRLGVEPDVRPSDVDERLFPDESPEEHVLRLAGEKAGGVDAPRDALVVGADTVVVVDRAVLGKPLGPDEAAQMLERLSGRDHRVCTGVHVRRGERHASSVTTTVVRFRELTRREILAYVETGEPMDKAGAYGIQGAGGAFVESVNGSDSNVIGLPLAEIVHLAAEVGVVLLPGGRVELA